MQLTTVLVLLASIYCASAIKCYKGNDSDVKPVQCDSTYKDTCATTTYSTIDSVTRGCASHEECKKWQDDAIKEKYPYVVECCNTDLCNKKGDASSYGGSAGTH
ncbi:ly6/PLAUR domain-containing protein 2-like [Ambystoma mexicanum]|uniref:ly6/PLAUR domain-containing protein 2-like n=1 Tax=Ambystoma mexicanum TaxID=8296 RepID=UPI0037E8612F